MALKGGSISLTGAAAALTGAVNGRVRARSITFLCPAANTGNVHVGGSNVDTDGDPAYFTLEPGRSFTPPPPADGSGFEVDFAALFGRASTGTQILQIIFVD